MQVLAQSVTGFCLKRVVGHQSHSTRLFEVVVEAARLASGWLNTTWGFAVPVGAVSDADNRLGKPSQI